MTIEVTKQTFEKIFKPSRFIPEKVEEHELYFKEIYFNSSLAQRGESIYNHTSSVWQYYLNDINA